MVNVPEVVWIDESGRIVRPNDVTYGDDRYKSITHIDSDRHLAALRAWVKGEAKPFDAAKVRALQRPPSATDQLARAHFGLGQWLHEQGRTDAAARHFVRGGELAPHDFMIRRGSMPLRGIDPMGPEFRKMAQEWAAAGEQYYHPLEA